MSSDYEAMRINRDAWTKRATEAEEAAYALVAENTRLQAEVKALTLSGDAAGWEVVGYAEENGILRSAMMTVFQRARNDVARREGGVCVGLTTFYDYPFAKSLVRDLQPILFPEVEE